MAGCYNENNKVWQIVDQGSVSGRSGKIQKTLKIVSIFRSKQPSMSLIALDLGGTKLASAVFSEEGEILFAEKQALDKRTGEQVGQMITQQVQKLSRQYDGTATPVQAIGVSVPGISYHEAGTVWAPNIEGWTQYPLLQEIRSAAPGLPVIIDSDRACSILGEAWKGAAQSCSDAIFIAVGTGIGAGILTGGKILRGAHDIAGCIGWMALEKPYKDHFRDCGCFESSASGEGIPKLTRSLLKEEPGYRGRLRNIDPETLTASDVFMAWEEGDELAKKILQVCVELWGMAAANLVSLFNPQKIIFGGGIFGPAASLLPDIRTEAAKWAQPVGMQMVRIEASRLGSQACLYGAALLALQNKNR
jgi:glucokinase